MPRGNLRLRDREHRENERSMLRVLGLLGTLIWSHDRVFLSGRK
jgi:hypothetical protein